MVVVVVIGVVAEMDSCQPDASFFSVGRYQKLWKSYVKLRHLLANSPKVKQIDKQKLTQREVSGPGRRRRRSSSNSKQRTEKLKARDFAPAGQQNTFWCFSNTPVCSPV